MLLPDTGWTHITCTGSACRSGDTYSNQPRSADIRRSVYFATGKNSFGKGLSGVSSCQKIVTTHQRVPS